MRCDDIVCQIPPLGVFFLKWSSGGAIQVNNLNLLLDKLDGLKKWATFRRWWIISQIRANNGENKHATRFFLQTPCITLDPPNILATWACLAPLQRRINIPLIGCWTCCPVLHVKLLNSDTFIDVLVLPRDFVVIPISFAVSLLSLAVAMHGAPATSDLQTCQTSSADTMVCFGNNFYICNSMPVQAGLCPEGLLTQPF